MKTAGSASGGIMWLVYRAVTSCGYFLAWPVFSLLAAFGRARRREWRERLGFLPDNLPKRALWLHAASVGEVAALGPVIGEIRRRRPRAVVLVSTMTEAGRRRAKAAYGLRVFLAPLDTARCVERWLERASPRALLVMETELWPVWLNEAAERAPVAWINGRISDRAFPRYLAVRPLLKRIFSRMRILCVIGRQDARRVKRLGAPAKAVHIMGNVKADLTGKTVRRRNSIPGPWLVAGSTRTGEDEIVLEAFKKVADAYPRARLCLAPRHLERVQFVENKVKRMGFTCERRSQGGKQSRVLILDTHGELLSFYASASAAFVGGTFVPVGGHNILEPASLGVPVFFGPYTANVREQAEGLVRGGGGFRVNSARVLGDQWIKCLRARDWARSAGRRARNFVAGQRGASRRIIGLLSKAGLI